MNKKQKNLLYRIIAAIVLTVALELSPADGWLKFVLFLIPYLTIGYETLIKACSPLTKTSSWPSPPSVL